MRRAFIVLLALLGTMLLAMPARAGGSGHDSGRIRVTVPDGRLTGVWWQQFMGHAGTLDRCDLGVPGVVFLAGTTGTAQTRTCSVPRGRSVLVPLINAECSTLEDHYKTYLQLRACAARYGVEFTDLSLTVDGRAQRGLDRFRVQSGLYVFTAVNGNPFGVVGGPTRSVADGYWALVGPFDRGAHVLSFGGSFPPGPFRTMATYTLLVN